MLRYGRIDIREGVYLTKSNKSKECMVSQYWYFNDGFNFQDSICNSCRDLATLSVNVSDNNIITVKNVGYCCIIHNISKSEQLIY